MHDNVTSQLAQLIPSLATSEDQVLAHQYAPRVHFDRHEPFLPLAVGYTVFHAPDESPSFQRALSLSSGVTTVIEYAIWWDWDIQHLYELEHVWVHLDSHNQIVLVEASVHGQSVVMMRDDGSLPVDENGRVELYAQPGKHAFAPSETWQRNLSEYSRLTCGERAGSDGVLVNDLFRTQLGALTEVDHRLVRRWLQHCRFHPSFTFDQSVDLRSVTLVPWPALRAWIPGRVRGWIDFLQQKPHIRAICLDCGDTLVDEGTEIKDENGVVLSADLIPGAADLIHELKHLGYPLALVADGPRGTFENVLKQHDLHDSFDAFSISHEVGAFKPAAIMFHTALRALAVPEDSYSQVVMVGNNLSRDIKGANDLGLISVWLDWSPRRSKIPADSSETPQYSIKQPLDLLAVLEQIETTMLSSD